MAGILGKVTLSAMPRRTLFTETKPEEMYYFTTSLAPIKRIIIAAIMHIKLGNCVWIHPYITANIIEKQMTIVKVVLSIKLILFKLNVHTPLLRKHDFGHVYILNKIMLYSAGDLLYQG